MQLWEDPQKKLTTKKMVINTQLKNKDISNLQWMIMDMHQRDLSSMRMNTLLNLTSQFQAKMVHRDKNWLLILLTSWGMMQLNIMTNKTLRKVQYLTLISKGYQIVQTVLNLRGPLMSSMSSQVMLILIISLVTAKVLDVLRSD